MSSLTTFTTALSSAQSKAAYTANIQSAASGVDLETLKAAVDAVLAGDDNASVSGDQAAALKGGFEFAVALVMALETEPGMEEKLDLYKYFKQARNEQPAQPSFYQMEAKYKYNAWKEISHISAEKAQARYIELVNKLAEKYGTKTA
ncbi:hypothetical protein PHISCL_10187 [Aspergillus sclerotialis]|uniref:ACB domain-containing protein n=1 Tax=Aspergillus sclerotialis TaxID=2070753 RepID=A0A3A2Z860_9EURO|nr:hypothetical protein PHISCL_10187 [Aspergillus sclerotialis]